MKEMKLVQQRDVIRGVRERWLHQYRYSKDSDMIGLHTRRSVGEIRTRVQALDLETCSVDDVNQAIGASGWADNACDFCDGTHETTVQMGDEPDYKARYLNVCKPCLGRALSHFPHISGDDHG